MGVPNDPEADLPTDEQGHLACDCHCVRCGYNLRGLLPEGVCPECATPIGKSVHGDLLQFSNPAWVEKLASGMNWLVAGLLLALLTGSFMFAGFAVMGVRPGRVPNMSVAGALFSTGVYIVSLVGYWKVTTRDPALGHHEIGLTARRVVRVWAVTNLFLLPIEESLRRLSVEVLIIVQIFTGSLSIIGTIAICVYASRLAVRMSDFRLAREIRIVMWGLIICTSLFYLGSTAVRLSNRGGGAVEAPSVVPDLLASDIMLVISGSFCIVSVVTLVFGVWGFVLIFQFRTALRRSAKLARRTWSGTAA